MTTEKQDAALQRDFDTEAALSFQFALEDLLRNDPNPTKHRMMEWWHSQAVKSQAALLERVATWDADADLQAYREALREAYAWASDSYTVRKYNPEWVNKAEALLAKGDKQ